MMASDKRKAYKSCIQRAITWLSRQQAKDGSLGNDPNTYYKIPWAMAISGEQDRAALTVNWINLHELDGSYYFSSKHSRKDRFPWPTKNTGGEATMAYLYAHVQVGSHLIGRFDISQKLLNTVLAYQDPVWGGFYGKYIKPGRGEMDLMTTSFCMVASLYNNRIDKAVKAARFLVTVKDIQPNLSEGIYVCMQNDGKLVTNYTEDDMPCYILKWDAKKQMYIFLGAAIMGLCNVYMVFPEPIFLEAAKCYYEWAMHWDDIWETPRSGKLARGAADLYRITQDPQYAQTAVRIADYIVNTQNKNGSWPAPPGNQESWTGEFVIHLNEILKSVTVPY